jgi:transcriptional regulator with XRE-family HTH domain
MSDEGNSERVSGGSLGPYLKAVRQSKGLTLRDVEEATGKEVSNAYLSQIENGKIAKPSPHILFSLAGVLAVAYDNLMERAGYIVSSAQRAPGVKHGRAATFAIENLTPDEEKALLDHLNYLRWHKGRS